MGGALPPARRVRDGSSGIFARGTQAAAPGSRHPPGNEGERSDARALHERTWNDPYAVRGGTDCETEFLHARRLAMKPKLSMKSNTNRRWNTVLALIAVGGLAVLAPATVEARSSQVRQALIATGVDPDAKGRVRVEIRDRRAGLEGRFEVRVRKLDALASFDVTLDGVRIGSLTTRRNGIREGTIRHPSAWRRPAAGGRSARPDGGRRERWRRSGAADRDLVQVDRPGRRALLPARRFRPRVRGPHGGRVRRRRRRRPGSRARACPIRAAAPRRSRVATSSAASRTIPARSARTAPRPSAARRGGVNLGSGSCTPNPCVPARRFPRVRRRPRRCRVAGERDSCGFAASGARTAPRYPSTGRPPQRDLQRRIVSGANTAASGPWRPW